MNAHSIHETVLNILGRIAPEADLEQLKPDVGFREQLDIDSMDFLNFVIGLHKALHVDIPEKDYPRLTTLHGCIAYFTSRDSVGASS